MMKNQRETLESKIQRVDTCVDEAKRQNEVIYKDVENWLTRAENELKETQNLQDEIDRIKCFKWCPKWGWRYCLSKKLAEKTPIISKLIETSNIAQMGYRRSLQGIEFITSTGFMDSKSSKSALNQIMEAINAVNMIGLHGMPGVGKTTLAKEVGKHAREQKLFDKVVMFTMSQNPNIRTIQDKVAEMFGLNFRTTTEEGRAEELWSRLKVEKHILIIIDDLWDEFKLESIGIPFGDDHKGYEAWVLFRDQAGLDDDCFSLNEVAKEVAGECKGLPLAIVTVAKALKDKSLDEWRDANQRFKDSTHLYDDEVLGGVLEPLKLSYDYLKKGNNQMTGYHIQMCFLLCSLFPEDAEIPNEILIVCGIGVGLFPNASSIEDKRKRIVEALKKLQKSGLLLETDDAETIRMHDVIRDFAHCLTSTGENRFMVKDKLKEWPDMVESFEGYTAIALWNCSSNIKIFPDEVEFSKLKTLFLQGESKWDGEDLPVVSNTFFEEMKALQVLFLQRVYFSMKGFNSLPNLKTLWCEFCKVENLSSSLTNMRSLEILALIGTEIDEISEELVKLSTLKYLRLSSGFGFSEFHFPPKLVSRYNIVVGGFYFSFEEALTIRRLRIENFSSSLSAFKNLFCNVGELNLNNVNGLKNIVPSIGKNVLSELTSLKLHYCDDMEFLIDITRDQGSIVAFSNLVKLKIERMVSLKGLCYGLSPPHRAIASFTRLKVVTIAYCHKLKTIFSPCVAQSMLCIEELDIYSCNEVEQVIGFAQEEEITKDDSHICYFPKLRILDIQVCKRLKYVCANTSTQGLQSLESVTISCCPQLMQIIKMEQNENGEDVVVPQVLLYLKVLRLTKI
ncbi:disease resistance protein [Gossypium australe]|uniref:Disease resistance protein n=1 Tax=Gossypium australe TaxID=47621 RepID=A0A5B6U9Y4_9ROSI|nr:disease resistance protein [Gossypium australe]